MSKKALVIEDDPDQSRMLAKRLSLAGFECRIAMDGMAAVREAQQFRPDLIILDLMFPGGGGLSVLQRLRMSTYTGLIPVIVLTAKDDPAYKQKVLEAGISSYYMKPYDLDKLAAEARKLAGLEPAGPDGGPPA